MQIHQTLRQLTLKLIAPAAVRFRWCSVAISLAFVLAFLIGLQGPAFAGHATFQESDDLSDLDLEELMDLDVVVVNVLGTHTHLKGDWMLGYQLMTMKMEGNRNGTQRVSTDDVLANFMVSPTKMRMAMHMTMLMYAPSALST